MKFCHFVMAAHQLSRRVARIDSDGKIMSQTLLVPVNIPDLTGFLRVSFLHLLSIRLTLLLYIV